MAPGRDNLIGDSNVFCSRLAQIVGTRVTAPTSSQRAAWRVVPDRHHKAVVDLGPWTGTVLTYDASGRVAGNLDFPPQRAN